LPGCAITTSCRGRPVSEPQQFERTAPGRAEHVRLLPRIKNHRQNNATTNR
jgi:hypothetical protein